MTVFTIAYNEAFFLPYFIAHYRRCFPGCRIVVYDNQSTDDTRLIAEEAGCDVIEYDTNGKLCDTTYLQIKNNCWKNTYGWALICDVDEICDFTSNDLSREAMRGNTIIRFKGFNMVNLSDNMEVTEIGYAVRAESYDKIYAFNALLLQEINYAPGCHSAAPVGTVKYSQSTYTCRHYKYINPDYMIARHAHFASRLSDENLRRGYGGHYQYTPDQIREEFEQVRKAAHPLKYIK